MSVSKSDQVARILVVDDIRDNLILVRTLLESEGYAIDSVSDGATALQKTLQSPPDLILLDVMMPEMDGYEVTRTIRSYTNITYVPILLITAFDESSVVEGLDAGADDFIRKPFDTNELLARVRCLLRLKHSIDEQQKMSRQREDFVSRLTHDLRTPLLAADRMLDLFQKETFGQIPTEMKQAIAMMIRSNQNLLEMVNNLLEVYRFDADKKFLNVQECDLQEIAQEVINELTPLAMEKNLTVKLETRLEKENLVLGDRLELRRVFNNLIGNAIKFTDHGTVEVSIFEKSHHKHIRQVIIQISDTGYGIAPEDKTTIFERFRQGKNKRSGSGLGLHLSQRIIEAHRGKIELYSQLGKGSTFTITLPMMVK
jgi:two-component system sensor histidine kinase/response regulator